jgi:hypothetical protein
MLSLIRNMIITPLFPFELQPNGDQDMCCSTKLKLHVDVILNISLVGIHMKTHMNAKLGHVIFVTFYVSWAWR